MTTPPSYADRLTEDALTLVRQGCETSALILLRKGIMLHPTHLPLRLLAGDLLHRSGKGEEALTLYDDSLRLFPDSPLLHNNRGVTLLSLGKEREAEKSFARALELDPSLMPARTARATALMRLAELDEALSLCNQVLAAVPDDPEAHWNRGLILLTRGNYREGFAEYEWRWKRPTFTSAVRHREIPLLESLPVPGVRVLVHAEQGFGDTIQFCRWIPLLHRIGSTVVFECHPELVRLMELLLPQVQVVPFGSPPPVDFQIPLLSLPHLFGLAREEEIPPPPSPPTTRARPAGPSRVGICWRGKAYPDPGRSIDVSLLEPLSRLSGVEWHSLSFGERAPFWMHDPTPTLKDFLDTARYLKHLDLVVSIDSAPAHLAATFGIPTLLMIPVGGDWRWGVERHDSPWYRSVRIFRQQQKGVWDDVVERVGREILRMGDPPWDEVSSRS